MLLAVGHCCVCFSASSQPVTKRTLSGAPGTKPHVQPSCEDLPEFTLYQNGDRQTQPICNVLHAWTRGVQQPGHGPPSLHSSRQDRYQGTAYAMTPILWPLPDFTPHSAVRTQVRSTSCDGSKLRRNRVWGSRHGPYWRTNGGDVSTTTRHRSKKTTHRTLNEDRYAISYKIYRIKARKIPMNLCMIIEIFRWIVF